MGDQVFDLVQGPSRNSRWISWSSGRSNSTGKMQQATKAKTILMFSLEQSQWIHEQQKEEVQDM